MYEIKSTSSINSKITGTVSFHLCVTEACNLVIINAWSVLHVPIVLEATFTDRRSKSIFLVNQKIVLYHSLQVPVLMVHDGRSENKRKISEIL